VRILNFRQSRDLVALIDPKGEFASNPVYMDWVVHPINGPIKTMTDKGWTLICEKLELDTRGYEFNWTWDSELEDLSLDDPT